MDLKIILFIYLFEEDYNSAIIFEIMLTQNFISNVYSSGNKVIK